MGSQGTVRKLLRPQVKLQSSMLMTKNLDNITEALRDTKHPFRKVEHHNKKPQKSRYERRKIREFLHLTDWRMMEEEAI